MAKSDGDIYYTNLSTPMHVETSCLYKSVLLRERYKYLVVKEKQKNQPTLNSAQNVHTVIVFV